jgi:hypothetical protein
MSDRRARPFDRYDVLFMLAMALAAIVVATIMSVFA